MKILFFISGTRAKLSINLSWKSGKYFCRGALVDAIVEHVIAFPPFLKIEPVEVHQFSNLTLKNYQMCSNDCKKTVRYIIMGKFNCITNA